MYLHLKKFEHMAANSQETTCYTADVWINNLRIGWVSNSGNGESDRFTPAAASARGCVDLDLLLEKIATELDAGVDGFESMTADLAGRHVDSLRNEVLFRLKGKTYDEDEWSVMPNPGLVADLRAYIERKLGAEVHDIYTPPPLWTMIPDEHMIPLLQIFPKLEAMNGADLLVSELVDLEAQCKNLREAVWQACIRRDRVYLAAVKARYGISNGMTVLVDGREAVVDEVSCNGGGATDGHLDNPVLYVRKKTKAGGWSKNRTMVFPNEYQIHEQQD